MQLDRRHRRQDEHDCPIREQQAENSRLTAATVAKNLAQRQAREDLLISVLFHVMLH